MVVLVAQELAVQVVFLVMVALEHHLLFQALLFLMQWEQEDLVLVSVEVLLEQVHLALEHQHLELEQAEMPAQIKVAVAVLDGVGVALEVLALLFCVTLVRNVVPAVL